MLFPLLGRIAVRQAPRPSSVKSALRHSPVVWSIGTARLHSQILNRALYSTSVNVAASSNDAATRLSPPVAKKVPYVHRYHGREYPDDYQWLRNDARTDPDMLAYIKAENDYAEALLKPTEPLKDTLYAEFLGRLKEDDDDVPVKRGEYLYYSRTIKGQQYPLYCRKHGPNAAEEVLLNLNTMGFEQVTLGAFRASPDHQWLAYSLDTKGSEKYTVYFKNLQTGQLLDEAGTIPDIANDLEWSQNGQYVYYTTMDEVLRPCRVHRHAFRTPTAQDVQLLEEKDGKFNVGLGKSRSEAYLFITSGSSQTSEVHYLPTDDPTGTFKLFAPREFDRYYMVEHFNQQFLVTANRFNGQKLINDALFSCPIDGPTDPSKWQEVLEHNDSIYLTDVIPFRGYVVISERSNALEQLRVLEPNSDGLLVKGAKQRYITYPESVYTVGALAGALPYDENVLRFYYSSLVTPPTVYDYQLDTNERTQRKQLEVIGYDPSLYATERIYAQRPANPPDQGPEVLSDAMQIPITLVYRRDMLRKDGSNPLWLYGYGSYGVTMDPTFQSSVVSLLDRGFIYAIAHVRGGAEWGRAWYELDGKFLRKRNTFRDFIAAADKLVADGYTRPQLMAIEGGSSGGLLMGAVVNMRPDLAHVAVASVPFVDVLNTMMDETIPLTVIEYEEWGNPNNRSYFDYIRSYSPYDNMGGPGEKRFPHMLIRAGLNDPRVQYWEPAKWCARLRSLQNNATDSKSILLLTKMGSGHFGASGRYDHLKDTAIDYAHVISLIDRERQALLPSSPSDMHSE